MYAAIVLMFYLHLYWHFHCILIHIFIYFHLYLYCLVSFPNPLAPGSDIQIHVSWGTRLVLLCLKRSVSCRKVALALQSSPTHLIMNAAIVFIFYLYLYGYFHCILIHIFIHFHLCLYCFVSRGV